MTLREVRAAPRSIASGGEVEGDRGAVTGRPSHTALVSTSTRKKYLVTTKVGETTSSHPQPKVEGPSILAGVVS